jgi:hypothetical protein
MTSYLQNRGALRQGSADALSVTTLTASGAATLSSTLAVTGASTLTGNVSVGGTLGVTGASTLTGAVSAGSTLAVTGASTLTGNVSAAGTVAVTSGSITSRGWNGNANEGVVFLGNTGNNYLYYDGTSYNFPTSPLTNLGSAVLTKATAPVVLSMVIDGGGSAITAGAAGDFEIPYAATITAVKAFADQSGSVSVDFLRAASGVFPPVTSLVAAAPLVLSSASSGTASLGTWTTSLAAGDILRPVTSGVATITRLTINITMTRA